MRSQPPSCLVVLFLNRICRKTIPDTEMIVDLRDYSVSFGKERACYANTLAFVSLRFSFFFFPFFPQFFRNFSIFQFSCFSIFPNFSEFVLFSSFPFFSIFSNLFKFFHFFLNFLIFFIVPVCSHFYNFNSLICPNFPFFSNH